MVGLLCSRASPMAASQSSAALQHGLHCWVTSYIERRKDEFRVVKRNHLCDLFFLNRLALRKLAALAELQNHCRRCHAELALIRARDALNSWREFSISHLLMQTAAEAFWHGAALLLIHSFWARMRTSYIRRRTAQALLSHGLAARSLFFFRRWVREIRLQLSWRHRAGSATSSVELALSSSNPSRAPSPELILSSSNPSRASNQRSLDPSPEPAQFAPPARPARELIAGGRLQRADAHAAAAGGRDAVRKWRKHAASTTEWYPSMVRVMWLRMACRRAFSLWWLATVRSTRSKVIAATNNAVRKRTAWNAWRERMEQWRKPPPTKLQNVEARRTRLRPVVRRSLRRWFLASCGQRVRRESTGQRCDALSYAAEFVRAGRVRVLRLSALHRWQSYALRNRTRLFWSVQQQSSVAVSMRNALCFWSVRALLLGIARRGASLHARRQLAAALLQIVCFAARRRRNSRDSKLALPLILRRALRHWRSITKEVPADFGNAVGALAHGGAPPKAPDYGEDGNLSDLDIDPSPELAVYLDTMRFNALGCLFDRWCGRVEKPSRLSESPDPCRASSPRSSLVAREVVIRQVDAIY